MGVLHIVHRVVAVLPHGEVEVKLHLRVALARAEEKARRVDRDLVEQVGQGDGLARALAHAHDLAALHEAHELHENKAQLRRVEPQRAHGRGETHGVAVVVGAPNVDDGVEAAGEEFVAMIGDVTHIVGVKAVGAAQHIVFFHAEFGGGKPERPVFFIEGAVFLHERQRLVHIGGIEGGFAKPHVVDNAVAGQIVLHLFDVALQRKVDELLAALRLVHMQKFVAVLRGKLPGMGCDIVAVIAVLGEGVGLRVAKELEVAALERAAEQVDLVAGVVEVKLALDIGPCPLENGGQRVAQNAAARVAQVHGPRGVGRDKLHLHFPAGVALCLAVVVAGLVDGAQRFGIPCARQRDVDKTGACDGHVLDVAQLVHKAHHNLRDFSRGHAKRLCPEHGKVGRQVAVVFVARFADIEVLGRAVGQRARLHRLAVGVKNGLAYGVSRGLGGVVRHVLFLHCSRGSPGVRRRPGRSGASPLPLF